VRLGLVIVLGAGALLFQESFTELVLGSPPPSSAFFLTPPDTAYPILFTGEALHARG